MQLREQFFDRLIAMQNYVSYTQTALLINIAYISDMIDHSYFLLALAQILHNFILRAKFITA